MVLDLGGNVRKNPKISGTTHNVFGIRVGVCITILVRLGDGERKGRIRYLRCDDMAPRGERFRWLNEFGSVSAVGWKPIRPKPDGTWIRTGLRDEFDAFPPMGSQAAKRRKSATGSSEQVEAVFRSYSNGVKTNRDAWTYNFDRAVLADNIRRTIQVYNDHLARWRMHLESWTEPDSAEQQRRRLEAFLDYDSRQIAWSERLKGALSRSMPIHFHAASVRESLYRPFTEQWLYFDEAMIERQYLMRRVFPTVSHKALNRVICVPAKGGRTAFWCLMAALIPEVHLTSVDAEQCFSLYTYNEDGTGQTENVTDWALGQYRSRYGGRVSKADIFYYHYAVLHHPTYRERYAANLRKSLPRVPLVETAKDFRALARAGRRLGDLHVDYERQREHPLREVWKEGVKKHLKVERMRLSKERTALHYNDALTLEGIPPETFDYRLGSRSALEWVVDQYRVQVDKASGIENDPNRAHDPSYIVGLVRKVITVSLETQKIIVAFPELRIAEPD
jgi:predicted helicase